MTCVNCYQKGSVPRTFLSAYYSTVAYGTAVDYTTAAVMENDGTAMTKHYDNIGVTFVPATGIFTVGHSGRFLIRAKVLATHGTTDGTHAILRINVDAAVVNTGFFAPALTNSFGNDAMYLEEEVYVSLTPESEVTLTLELVGHTTGDPELTPSRVFVEIIELT